MFKIDIHTPEFFDEEKEEFINSISVTLELEHSLISLSKWESKWCKPFLSKENKSYEESIDYVKCMTINEVTTNEIYSYISKEELDTITTYIEAPMTATVFSKNETSGTKEVITAEIIYYWMIALKIPILCQEWHLNRLLTLINVVNIKQTPPKKMNKKEVMSRNAQLNAQRKKQLNTKG